MPAPIPDYSNVSLLLPMSGANNGTAFTDYSPTPKTITRSGTPVTSTSQYKYYGSSGYFDGTGDYLTTPYSADFNVGSAITIQAWVYSSTTDATNDKYICTTRPASGTTTGWSLLTGPSTNRSLRFGAYAAAGVLGILLDSGASVLSTDTWHHVAVTYNAGTWRLFLDGVLVSSGVESAPIAVSNTLYIGSIPGFTTRDWQGFMQDFLILKGTCLYEASFTPPQRLIGNISGTVKDHLENPVVRKIFAVPRSYQQKAPVVTTSAADGTFSMTSLPACEYSVVAIDDGDTYNDLVLRRLPA